MTSLSSWLLTGLCEFTTLSICCGCRAVQKIAKYQNIKIVLRPLCPPPSDRTCTVLNVESDAFGAGLLQFFQDRTSKKDEGELNEVKLDPLAESPESSPFIEKRGGRDGAKTELSAENESVM